MMKKKILAIELILVVLATVFACGCLDDYYTSLDAADAKLTEAAGYIYAYSELIDQERFDAADAKLDEAVTAISMAEANVYDAKDMGAPKEETVEYDAAIIYLKRGIHIGRSTINICKLVEEMDEKGYSEDLNQKLVAETDKMLINLNSAEMEGLNLIERYPTTASELEVAKDIKDIKSLKKEFQDLKNVLLTTTYTVTTPTPIPEGYYEDKCRIPVDVSLIDWLVTYKWADEYEVNGVWDCSQMTAALEWYLENCRYETVMKQGTGPGGGGHAWILIWLPKGTTLSKEGHTAPKDGYYIYEATGQYFVTDVNQLHGYKTEKRFDDIYAAWEYWKVYGEEAFLDEYGWWE